MERFTRREGGTTVPGQFPGSRRPHASVEVAMEEVPLTQEVAAPEEAPHTPPVGAGLLQEEVLRTPPAAV